MKNWVLAALCAAFAAVCFHATLSFPDPGVLYRSPAAYPRAVIAVILVLSAVLVAIQVFRKRAAPTTTTPVEKASFLLSLVVLAALVAYFLLMPIIGFIVATFAFILGMFRFFGGTVRTGTLFAGAMTAGLYILFAILLDVRVPDPVVAFVRHSF